MFLFIEENRDKQSEIGIILTVGTCEGSYKQYVGGNQERLTEKVKHSQLNKKRPPRVRQSLCASPVPPLSPDQTGTLL